MGGPAGARRRCRRLAAALRPRAHAARPCPPRAAYATFLEELRDYSMKLHTKSQAPKEGQAPEPRNQKPVGRGGGWLAGHWRSWGASCGS